MKLSPMEETPHWSSGRSPPPEEETVAETTCDGLNITIPISLCLKAGGDRESGIKLSLGRRKGLWDSVFKI